MSELSNIIHTIHLTEKATLLNEQNNEYVFKVDRKANKLEIRKAVEAAFGKTVVGVRTANYAGKQKRKRSADAGRTAHWKKAIVRFKAGESLDFV